MIKTQRLSLLAVLLLCSVVVFAQNFTVDGVNYRITSAEKLTVEVSENKGFDHALTIPESVEYQGVLYSVTSIGNDAFDGCNRLSGLNISKTVTSIGDCAFRGCENLYYVTIPDKVTSIGENAFSLCNNLTRVTIGKNVTIIGSGAFDCCDNLTTVTMGKNTPVTIIGPTFSNRANTQLFVPQGSKADYEVASIWNEFKDIQEMVLLDPIDGELTVNLADLENKDLSNNVVDNIYYNLGVGAYDTTDGSIVIRESTQMGLMMNYPMPPGTNEMVNGYKGLVLKLSAGEGSIKVNCKTEPGAYIIMQIDNSNPGIHRQIERGDFILVYRRFVDSYLYIYANINSSSSSSQQVEPDNAVKIYGITLTPNVTGISSIEQSPSNNDVYYTLDGRKIEGPPTTKGIYIVNRHKVMVQ